MQNDKSTSRLTRQAILKTYPDATNNTTKQFHKEGLNFTPDQLKKATQISFKMPLGPAIRNFNFRLVTRQVMSDKVIGKIENRPTEQCKYNGEQINN